MLVRAQKNKKEDGSAGPHHFKFGKCSFCGKGEGEFQKKVAKLPVECPKNPNGTKHIGGYTCKFCKELLVKPNQEAVAKAFQFFDTDGSGFLELDELKKILMNNKTGSAFSEDEVNKVMQKFDENGDGKLSMEEFAAYMANSAKKPGGISALGGMSSRKLMADAVDDPMSKPLPKGWKRCPHCVYEWQDKHGKDECPKCLKPLSAVRTSRLPGEASLHKADAASAMESDKGECPKGGAHHFKFGKCSKCGLPEGKFVAQEYKAKHSYH